MDEPFQPAASTGAVSGAAARFGAGFPQVTLGSGIRRRHKSDSTAADCGLTDEGASEQGTGRPSLDLTEADRRMSHSASSVGTSDAGGGFTRMADMPPQVTPMMLAQLMGDDGDDGDDGEGCEDEGEPPSPTACSSPLRELPQSRFCPPPVPQMLPPACEPLTSSAWDVGGYVDSSGTMVPEGHDVQSGVAVLNEDAVDELLSSPRSPLQPKFQPEDRCYARGVRPTSPLQAPASADDTFVSPSAFVSQEQRSPREPMSPNPPQREIHYEPGPLLRRLSAVSQVSNASGGGRRSSAVSDVPVSPNLAPAQYPGSPTGLSDVPTRVVRRIVYVTQPQQPVSTRTTVQPATPQSPPVRVLPTAQPFQSQGSLHMSPPSSPALEATAPPVAQPLCIQDVQLPQAVPWPQ